MPYIKQDRRVKYYPVIRDITNILLREVPEDQKAGELNYLITCILNQVYPLPNYREYNEIIGVLESCKMEFYRRRVAPYEDTKVCQNGDV